MIKSGVFKKVVALVAALTLVCAFAIGASAATISSTTTTYNADASKVDVVVNVTAIPDAYVTYYAVNAAAEATQGVVFADQTTADESGAATFNFTTEAAYLESEVLVGETDVDNAGTGTIEGNAVAMTGSTTDAYVLPNGEATATLTFNYAFGYNRTLDAVAADNATVTDASFSEGVITVVLADIDGDVTLTVTEKAAVVDPDIVMTNHAAAGVVVAEASENGTDDEFAWVTAGDKKLSVLGQITGIPENREFGVVISVDEIAEGEFDELANTYKAMGKADSGHFAIQVIDAEIEVTDYNTAVYYVNADGKYVVSGVSVASFIE